MAKICMHIVITFLAFFTGTSFSWGVPKAKLQEMDSKTVYGSKSEANENSLIETAIKKRPNRMVPKPTSIICAAWSEKAKDASAHCEVEQ